MPEKKSVLIIAGTFYPDPKVNSVRPTEWSRHLPEFGWKPYVLCRYYGVELTSEQLAQNVNPEVALYYLRGSEGVRRISAGSGDEDLKADPAIDARVQPSLLHRVLSKNALIRTKIAKTIGTVCVPDVSINFWWRARQAILQTVDSLRPDVVLTTAPPFGPLAVGRWLKRERPETTWIADFQDPFQIDSRFAARGLGKLMASQFAEFERSICEEADLITYAIPVHCRWARRAYPEQKSRMRESMMGVSTRLACGDIPPVAPPAGVKSIRVMGSQAHQQVRQLVRAVSELNGSGIEVELRYIGSLPGSADEYCRELKSCFVATGQIPHREAMGQLLGGDVLVCALSRRLSRCKGLSSKLFEFLACGKPIIVVNPTGPDRHFLHGMKGVRMLIDPTEAQIKESLEWGLSGDAGPPPEQIAAIRERCSYRARVGELAEWMDDLLQQNRR